MILIEQLKTILDPRGNRGKRRVFQQVDAQAWVDAFNVWAICHAPDLAGQLWSMDSKSIKCTSVGGNTLHQDFATLVSVYGTEVGVVQLDLMYNAQSSEVEVAKRLLKRVTRNPSLAQSLPTVNPSSRSTSISATGT